MEKIPLPKLESLPTTRVVLSSLLASDSPRCSGENLEHAERLAESEDPLPPIVVNRATMRIVDGMHRFRAAMLRGEQEIEVRFFDGDDALSFVLAVSENIRHGLPLSLTDRKSAAVRILDSYPEWSDRMIASVTGLSAKTASAIRRDLAQDKAIGTPEATVGKDGRVRPRDREHRRELARKLMIADPDASLRTIARQAGISPETARVVRKRLYHNGPDTPAGESDSAQASGSRKQQTRRPPAAQGNSGAISADGLAIRSLAGDPAFRSTEGGRSLLRMLAAYDTLRRHGDKLVEQIPDHCLGRAEKAALACATQWQIFAESIADAAATSPLNGDALTGSSDTANGQQGAPLDRTPY